MGLFSIGQFLEILGFRLRQRHLFQPRPRLLRRFPPPRAGRHRGATDRKDQVRNAEAACWRQHGQVHRHGRYR